MLALATHQPFDLTVYEVDSWDLPPHRHQFLELVFVLAGQGTHTINQNTYPYAPGSLFVLTPADTHTFAVAERSRLAVLVVTELYAHQATGGPADHHALGVARQPLEYIFLHHRQAPGELLRTPADRQWVGLLFEHLLTEVTARPLGHEAMMRHLVALLLAQVARAIQESHRPPAMTAATTALRTPDLAYDLTTYIQQHIYDNDRLRLDALAAAFHRPKAALSRHFQAQTGETIKDYIRAYKLHLVQTRLQYSTLTIAQIADELGFTDESHLNKLFRQRLGTTAAEFRRAMAKIGP